MSEFVATKNVSGFLEIDENRKEWRIPEKELYKLSFTEQMSTKRFMNSVRSVFKKREEHIYSFSDILDVEILENGSAVTLGGAGEAIAGGVLFGAIGAMVGSMTASRKTTGICESLQVKITLNDTSRAVEYIDIITTSTKKTSGTYKKAFAVAQDCLSVLKIVQNEVCETNSNQEESMKSEADELMKFKQLLDAGVITQEEFDMKKKQILGF